MKKLTSLLTALVFASLVIFMSCGGGDDPQPPAKTDQEIAQENLLAVLGGGASPSAVTDGDNANATGDWSGFTLTLTETGYTSSGAPAGFEVVWPTTGSWSFADGETSTSITRTGGAGEVTVTLSNVSETSVTMSFSIPESFVARTSGLVGNWSFTF